MFKKKHPKRPLASAVDDTDIGSTLHSVCGAQELWNYPTLLLLPKHMSVHKAWVMSGRYVDDVISREYDVMAPVERGCLMTYHN